MPDVTAASERVVDAEAISEFVQRARDLERELRKVIVGQHEAVRQVLIALFGGGHVLLEGVPGLGKTLLVRTLGEALSLRFSRIQFTPDLMPADIIGTTIVSEDLDGRRALRFQAGTGFRQPGAGRRDQSRHAQDAVGAAGGDAGADGQRRRGHATAAATVLRACDAESARDGRHLPAA